MHEANIAGPAVTKWASPVIFVAKKDDRPRFRVDYRCLNAVTKTDSYSVPWLDKCINLLGKDEAFLTFAASSGYWQKEMHDKDVIKTRFFTHHGLNKHTRMPIGFRNAIATNQRAVWVILGSLKWQHAIVFIENITSFLRTKEKRLMDIDKMTWLLKEAGKTIKLKQSFFINETKKYLEHLIAPGRLRLGHWTTKAKKCYKT